VCHLGVRVSGSVLCACVACRLCCLKLEWLNWFLWSGVPLRADVLHVHGQCTGCLIAGNTAVHILCMQLLDTCHRVLGHLFGLTT
jgi:hypothetical protein